jgi:hypothetical protein
MFSYVTGSLRVRLRNHSPCECCLEKHLRRVQFVQRLVSPSNVQAVQLVVSAEANAQAFQWLDMSA